MNNDEIFCNLKLMEYLRKSREILLKKTNRVNRIELAYESEVEEKRTLPFLTTSCPKIDEVLFPVTPYEVQKTFIRKMS